MVTSVCSTGGYAEKESLNGNDIDGIDERVTVDVSGGEPASRWNERNTKEMALRGDDVDGVNLGRAWWQCCHRWGENVIFIGGEVPKLIGAR